MPRPPPPVSAFSAASLAYNLVDRCVVILGAVLDALLTHTVHPPNRDLILTYLPCPTSELCPSGTGEEDKPHRSLMLQVGPGTYPLTCPVLPLPSPLFQPSH